MPVRIPGFTPTRRRVKFGGMVSRRRESDEVKGEGVGVGVGVGVTFLRVAVAMLVGV